MGTMGVSATPPAQRGRRSLAAELLLLAPLGPRLQAVIVASASLLALGWGVLLVLLQRRLVDQVRAGRVLGGIPALIAAGSSPALTATAWLAAILFAASALRTRRGALEPPAGGGGDDLTVGELRRRYRREYRWARGALVAVSMLALLASGRELVFLAAAAVGDRPAASALPWLSAEALGMVAAAAMLALWVAAFREQLARIGAVDP